jgi:hypothetical protein
MKIFISHSLPRSRELAERMEWFLRMVLPATEPWMSTGIDKGADWGHEIGQSLQEAAAGVVCLTPENLDERWILFESGALAKQFGTKVCTLLLDVKKEEVKPPLSKFQHTSAEREEVRKLIDSINKVAGGKEKGRRDADVNDAFDSFWPKLDATIEKLRAQGPPAGKAAPKRTAEDMMAEILTAIRALEKEALSRYVRQNQFLQKYSHLLTRQARALREHNIGRTAVQELEAEVMERLRASGEGNRATEIELEEFRRRFPHQDSELEIKTKSTEKDS